MTHHNIRALNRRTGVQGKETELERGHFQKNVEKHHCIQNFDLNKFGLAFSPILGMIFDLDLIHLFILTMVIASDIIRSLFIRTQSFPGACLST